MSAKSFHDVPYQLRDAKSPVHVHTQLPSTASPKNQPEQHRKSSGINLRKPSVTQLTILNDPLQ